MPLNVIDRYNSKLPSNSNLEAPFHHFQIVFAFVFLMSEMEDTVVVVRPATNDVMKSPITSILELVPFTLCQRFGLQLGDIVEIQKQDSMPRGLAGPSVMVRSDGS